MVLAPWGVTSPAKDASMSKSSRCTYKNFSSEPGAAMRLRLGCYVCGYVWFIRLLHLEWSCPFWLWRQYHLVSLIQSPNS